MACSTQAQTIGLNEAVSKAIAYFPVLKQRQAEIGAAKAHVNTVKGNSLPSLVLQDQLDMGTNNSLQGSYLTYGMIPSTPGNNNSALQNNSLNPNNVALSSLQWDFYNFGYFRAQQKEARAMLAVNEANMGNDKYLLTQNIIALYLDWLKKYRLLQIQNDNLDRAQVMLTAIRATVLSGLKPGVDSSTARAAYSDARIAWLQAMDEYNSDRISIASFTGLGNNNLAPDSSFINSAMIQAMGKVPEADSVTTTHPIINVFEKQYEAQLAGNNAISKKYLPHLGLAGVAWMRNSGISYAGVYPENPLDGLPYSKYNYLFGVNITYNLFDLKHRHDELAEGAFQAQARQSALQMQELSLNTTLQQTNATYATTLEKLKELPLQLFSARQAYGQQMALYRSGLNTLIELTNAQYALLQAENNYVIAQDELLQLLFIRAGLAGQLDSYLGNFK